MLGKILKICSEVKFHKFYAQIKFLRLSNLSAKKILWYNITQKISEFFKIDFDNSKYSKYGLQKLSFFSLQSKFLVFLKKKYFQFDF